MGILGIIPLRDPSYTLYDIYIYIYISYCILYIYIYIFYIYIYSIYIYVHISQLAAKPRSSAFRDLRKLHQLQHSGEVYDCLLPLGMQTFTVGAQGLGL